MMGVRKLLYASDIWNPRFSEVEPLLDLRTEGFEEVILLNTTKVEGWEKRLADFGLNTKTLIVEGPLVPCILKAVRQESVALIAASLNRDTHTLKRAPLTKNLLRSSPVPVIIFHEDGQAYGSMKGGVFSHVVFASDWSPASEKALNYVLNFKAIIKELEIVHVIDKKLSVRDIRRLKDRLAQTRKRFLDQGIDAEVHVYAGKTYEEIMLAARDYNATCIVMGTTGKSALKDFFSRSCSYRVAEASVVPVLFVP